jgi:hypothetical protein
MFKTLLHPVSGCHALIRIRLWDFGENYILDFLPNALHLFTVFRVSITVDDASEVVALKYFSRHDNDMIVG